MAVSCHQLLLLLLLLLLLPLVVVVVLSHPPAALDHSHTPAALYRCGWHRPRGLPAGVC